MTSECHSCLTHITESQNHRMVGVGRGLCGSSSPNPLPKHGHIEQTAQDLVQVGFEYLQRKRLHSPSGQPVPVLSHPQREEVLPHVHFILVPLRQNGILCHTSPKNFTWDNDSTLWHLSHQSARLGLKGQPANNAGSIGLSTETTLAFARINGIFPPENRQETFLHHPQVIRKVLHLFHLVSHRHM